MTGSFRFAPITPTALKPGTYVIAEFTINDHWTFTHGDNGAGETFDSRIVFDGFREADNVSSLQFPNLGPGGCDCYFGPNFMIGGCQVTPTVLPISQSLGSPGPWGGLPYDHLGLDKNGNQITIARKGCALTSLTMALNFEGESWNPGTINSLLNATSGGYVTQGTSKGNVAFGTATLLSNGGRVGPLLVYDNLGGTVDTDVQGLTDAIQAVENEICAESPHPVIVGVRSQHPNASGVYKYPGHFVLITGEIVNPDGSKAFTINDPAGYSTVLGTDSSTSSSGYTNGSGQPEFQTRGTGKPTAVCGLQIYVAPRGQPFCCDHLSLGKGHISESN
jgi:hypothetical protein